MAWLNGLLLLPFAALALGAASSPARAAGPVPWVVYYSNQAPIAAFDPYKVVVLDSDTHPPLRPLLDRGKTVLGYLSLGEVENHRPWFNRVKAMGMLSIENENWSGSFYVDVRDKRWTAMIVEELIPRLLHQGFQGIFMDTLDNPPDLERRDPEKFAGMTKGTVRLVRAIRKNYPDLRMMLNRAYEILPDVADIIDLELGESVYTTWDFKENKAKLQPDEDYQTQVRILTDAGRRNPKLQIMTLDYWDVQDTPGVKRIYDLQRGNGFSPYVSVISLDRIVPEPERRP